MQKKYVGVDRNLDKILFRFKETRTSRSMKRVVFHKTAFYCASEGGLPTVKPAAKKIGLMEVRYTAAH